jgi:hypothetical protein
MRLLAGIHVTRVLLLSFPGDLKQVFVVALATFDPLEVLEDRLNLDGAVHGCEFDSVGHEVKENLEIPVRVPIYEKEVVHVRFLVLMRDLDALACQLAVQGLC